MKKKVLLIDDDIDDVEIFCEILNNVRDTVCCCYASGALDALKKLKEMDILPDLIFLDVGMPAVSGIDFLALLGREEKFSLIPVILMSTCSLSEQIAKGISSGALCYFVKPGQYAVLKKILTAAASGISKDLNDSLLTLHRQYPEYLYL